MSEYIPDISIPSSEYVSLNTLSGVSAGTAFTVQSKGTVWVRLVESATQPANTVEDGVILTNLTQSYATATIKLGSLSIWAISTQDGRTGKVTVQEDV